MSEARILNEAAVSRRLDALLVVSSATLIAGLFIAPDRVADTLLVAAYAALTVFLGGLVFLSLHYISGARWSEPVTRVYVALTASLWLGSLAMLLVIAFRRDAYAWLPPGGEHAGTFWFKAAWLDSRAFVVRAAIYLGVWSLLAVAMVRNRRATDSLDGSSRNHKLSAITLLLFAPTFTLAASDWFMTLEPMWFSTVWGSYHFAGLATSTLAVVVLAVIQLRGSGMWYDRFTDDHLHDLGKLLLGFSCFWMYLWFCQYMLIWYSNIPEETAYFVRRAQGAWGPLMIANVLLNWGIPFLALLPRPAKRSATTMTRVAVIMLVGRWLDLYLMVYPTRAGEAPQWGAWEAAGIVLVVAAVARLSRSALANAKPLAVVETASSGVTQQGSHAATS